MEETQSDPSKGEPLIRVAVGSTRIYSCESSHKSSPPISPQKVSEISFFFAASDKDMPDWTPSCCVPGRKYPVEEEYVP